MNQWSRTRKRIILMILILVVVVLVGIPMFLLFYEKPNCFDGKQNGDEVGVDCGGSCQLLCRAESLPLLLKGDPRILSLATTTYQVVAVVENSNNSAEIYRAGYILKIFDSASVVPVREIKGFSYVPPGSTFVIFEGPFSLPEGVVPSRAILEWREETVIWKKAEQSTIGLKVRGINLTRATSSPRVDAMVENTTLDAANNIDLTALLYDSQGNIFAASKTYIDTLAPGASSPVVFTWPRPFSHDAAKTHIVLRIFPDRSFIR